MQSCDTNILFYALNADCPEHSAARSYIASVSGAPDFVLCELVLVELYVLLRNPKLNAKPASAPQTVDAIRGLKGLWKTVDYPGDLMEPVWNFMAQPNIAARRIFDVRLAITLRQAGVRHFATRNVRDFQGLGFTEVFDPIGPSA